MDGRLVAGSGSTRVPSDPAPYLSTGLHDIEVRFSNGGGGARVLLIWAPADGGPGVIPSKYLYPP